jgi:hypothetical protein
MLSKSPLFLLEAGRTAELLYFSPSYFFFKLKVKKKGTEARNKKKKKPNTKLSNYQSYQRGKFVV